MRGQYFSFDIIIALALFVMTFIFVMSYWFSINAVMESQYSSAQDVSQRIGNAFFTPGIPEDWETGIFDDAREIGLTQGYNNSVLSSQKWIKMQNVANLPGPLGYENFKDKINSAGWEVCLNLTIVEISGTGGTAGNCTLPDSAHSNAYYRIGAVNVTTGPSSWEVKPAILKVTVWRDANTSMIR
ncbi:hypothetical protein KO465_01220 [Candidatus Micrarchaeota archaeon]|nr:hypothetical protein [Candidatus Micrarchaeota archaeon]